MTRRVYFDIAISHTVRQSERFPYVKKVFLTSVRFLLLHYSITNSLILDS